VKLLILESDPTNISILVESLYPLGLKFDLANNSRKAYSMALEQQPEVIVAGWGISTPEVIDTLKRLTSSQATTTIPFLLIRDKNEPVDNQYLVLRAGALDVLAFPFDNNLLSLKIGSIIRHSSIFKKVLEEKNAELTAITTQVLQQNEFREKLLKMLNAAVNYHNLQPETAARDILEAISFIKAQKNQIDWIGFKRHFMELNPQFPNKLIQVHPNLTPSEIKLCSLLRLNLNTKEISSLLSQTPESLRVARTRLRKKLNIESEKNLVGYLMRFG